MILSLHGHSNSSFKESRSLRQRTQYGFFDHRHGCPLLFLSLCLLPRSLLVTSTAGPSHPFIIIQSSQLLKESSVEYPPCGMNPLYNICNPNRSFRSGIFG